MDAAVLTAIQTLLNDLADSGLAQFAWVIATAGAVMITFAVTSLVIRKFRGMARI